MRIPLCLAIATVFLSPPPVHAQLEQADLAWLKTFGASLVASNTKTVADVYRPGETIEAVVPGGGYGNIFIADYKQTCESRLVPVQDVKDALVYLTHRYGGYYLGTVDQGWSSFRREPEPSPLGKGRLLPKEGWTEANPQNLAQLHWIYWKLSGDLSVFNTHHQVVSDYLLGHTGFFQKKDGLVWLDEADVMDPQFVKRGYGFYDTVPSSGYNLYSSLMVWDAYQDLGEMYAAAGDTTRSLQFYGRARVVASALVPTFFNEGSKMLLSSTGVNRQDDVWGSAYAVALGALDDNHEQMVAQALTELVRTSAGIVWRGQVRHMVDPNGWQRAERPVNRYQNGAYWGAATGWLFRAVHAVEPPLAEQMIREMIDDYRNRGAFECVHPSGNYTKGPNYVNSVTLPLAGLIEEGYYPDQKPMLWTQSYDNVPSHTEGFELYPISSAIDNNPPGTWTTAGTIAGSENASGLYAQVRDSGAGGGNYLRVTADSNANATYSTLGRAVHDSGLDLTEDLGFSLCVDVLAAGGNDNHGSFGIGLQEATGADDGSRKGLAFTLTDEGDGNFSLGIIDLTSYDGSDAGNRSFKTRLESSSATLAHGSFDRIWMIYDPDKPDNLLLEALRGTTVVASATGNYDMADIMLENLVILQTQGTDAGGHEIRASLDNLTVMQAIPEPGTLALLGTGGLLCLLRRLRR